MFQSTTPFTKLELKLLDRLELKIWWPAKTWIRRVSVKLRETEKDSYCPLPNELSNFE